MNNQVKMNDPVKKTNCDFCGHHKNEVPLLIVSNVTNAGICGNCATLVIQQTMRHQMRTGIEFKKIVDAFPDLFEQDENGAVKVVPGDKRLDTAIRAVENDKTDEEDYQDGDEETLCEEGEQQSTVEST